MNLERQTAQSASTMAKDEAVAVLERRVTEENVKRGSESMRDLMAAASPAGKEWRLLPRPERK